MNPKVSIIIPAYNAEKYIEECLDSIRNQELTELEIIVVNDGSTDGTSSILDRYKEMDPRIIVVSQTNQGLAMARANGFKHATADYIGWVDSDDFVETSMFKTLYDTAVREDSDLVICNYRFYPQKVAGKEKWFKEFKGDKDWHFIERNTNAWNKLIRRDLCEKIHFYEGLVEYSDSIYIKAILCSKRPVTINQELYNYRVGQISMSYGFSGKVGHFEHVVEMANKQKNFLKEIDQSIAKELDEYFDYRYIYALLQLLLVSAYNSDKVHYSSAKKILKSIRYKENRLTSVILKENHGAVKAFVLHRIVPSSYLIAMSISKAVWGRN